MINNTFDEKKLDEIVTKAKELFADIKYFDLSVYNMLLSENKEYLSLLKLVSENMFSNFSDLDLAEFKSYTKVLDDRLDTVIKYAFDNQCMIMVDAEQTYLQSYIDYITAYYFLKYNKDKCTLLNTLQCYLKDEQEHYLRWKNYARNNNLNLGIKLVRGAYMTEETLLANKYGYSNPVCDNIKDTHVNYDKTVDNIFNDYKKGDKFIIATHNLESIELLGNNFKSHGQNPDIICAQLLGIAEHATGYCKQNVNINFYIYIEYYYC